MSYLFFDTETTGLPAFSMPSGHESQPRCVQLAAILTDDAGNEMSNINVIIKPDGWSIPKNVSDIHGITTEIAEQYGVREIVAAGLFYDLLKACDMHIAHNLKFDRQIIGTMFARSGRDWGFSGDSYCTLQTATPIVNLPPTERMVSAGFNKPKPPKLEECIRHFFGEELDGAHDALVDVRACKRIFFHMREMEQQTQTNGGV